MFWSVVEHNRMRGIGEKRGARGHGLENPPLALLPQVLLQAIVLRHKAHQAFGLMNVEIVQHEMPPGRLIIGGHCTGYVRHKVLFGACRPQRRRHDRALSDVKIGDQRQRATPDIFELAPLLLARFHEPGGMFAL
jgi:hypothetical protein